MSKPTLAEPYRQLEGEVIDTLLAGHHEWRSDLAYPESYSDMAGAFRALIRKYDVKLRPVPLDRAEILDIGERPR